jgi:predicted acylesterase/phospholipase RssA
MNPELRTGRLSQPRIGWVFEGGGAKGSFSFAAARRLIRAGVPMHCVSGTSVEALSALLFSCHQADTGEQLWARLGRQDVLPFKSWKISAGAGSG